VLPGPSGGGEIQAVGRIQCTSARHFHNASVLAPATPPSAPCSAPKASRGYGFGGVTLIGSVGLPAPPPRDQPSARLTRHDGSSASWRARECEAKGWGQARACRARLRSARAGARCCRAPGCCAPGARAALRRRRAAAGRGGARRGAAGRGAAGRVVEIQYPRGRERDERRAGQRER
jgi:hypothetical protein